MSAYRVSLFLLTLFLLVLSIYETWATGRIYGIIPIVAFSFLLPYEFAQAFLPKQDKTKPRKH
jgi:hypothetical protein